MKFTITRINKQNQLMVSQKSIDRFWERIAKDDAKQSVANFRMSAPLMEGDYHNYIGMKQWQQVYPAAEFGKDESGSLIFKKSNGLMMLHFINLTTEEEINDLKKTASLLPMTFAAIKGADGRSLIVLVCIADETGQVPQNEQDAEQLHLAGYESVKNLYLSQIPPDSKIILKAEKPTLKSCFMLTQDASPYYNSKAVAMRIAKNSQLSAAAPKRVDNLKAFEDNEFLYMKAVQEAQADMAEANMKWVNENDQFFAFLSAVAAKLCRMGMSEEEAFTHIRRNNWNDATEEEFRQIVSSAYATHSKNRKTEKASSGRKGRADILQMKNFLQSRYQFRYNAVMKYTEYPCPRPHRFYPKSALGRLVLHLVSGHDRPVARFLSSPIRQQHDAAAHFQAGLQQEHLLSPSDTERTVVGLHRQPASFGEAPGVAGHGTVSAHQPG